MPLRQALNVVLHQTHSSGNLGAVARLMANFGFRRLILSDPALEDFEEARKMAIKGEALDLVSAVRVEQALPAAVAECVYAVGTSMRTLEGRPPLTPEQAVERLIHHSARGPVALVFGGEKRGLSDADLASCQDVCAIPTEPAQPSMNLAQSAAVLLYLCARAEHAGAAAPVADPGARLGTLQALEAKLRDALLAAQFLNPEAPDHILRELMVTLGRAALSQREAELWLTAFKHVARACGSTAGRGK